MNNQIEEIVALMCGERKSCKACKSGNPNANAYCRIEHYAEALYNAGYRKTEDVAREIFEEIEKLLKNQEAVTENARVKEVADWIFHDYLPRKLAELKKKYESEGAE